MLDYLVISGSFGAPGELLGLMQDLERSARDELSYVSSTTVASWISTTGMLGVLAWQPLLPAGRTEPGSVQDEQGMTLLAGHAWPASGPMPEPSSWVRSLRLARLEGRSIAELRETLYGTYSVVEAHRDGRVTVFNDPFNAAPVYTGELAGLQVVSNRAGLVARALRRGTPPPHSPAGAAWVIGLGHGFGTSSGFEDVRRLAAEETVVIEPHRGMTIARGGRPLWQIDGPPVPWQDAAPLAREAWGRNVEHLLSFSDRAYTVPLTGGKDSRLLLALLLERGLEHRVTFQTSGPPDHPDVLVASQLAREFGLEHVVVPPSDRGESQDVLDHVREHNQRFGGMFEATELRSRPQTLDTTSVTFGGLWGEICRCAFMKDRDVQGRWSARLATEAMAPLDLAGILRDESRLHCRQQIRAWADDLLERGARGYQLPDIWYVEQRMARWIGPQQEATFNRLLHPLQSVTVTRLGYALPRAERRADRVHFEVIRQCSPELAKVPLADDSWSPRCYEQLSDADDYRQMAPVRAPKVPAVSLGRAERNAVLRHLVQGQVLGQDDHPAFEVVDRQRLVGLLAGPPSSRQTLTLARLVGAAQWLASEGGAATRRPPTASLQRRASVRSASAVDRARAAVGAAVPLTSLPVRIRKKLHKP